MRQIKSKIKLDDIMQTLSNGKKVFDFHKIESLGFPMHLIMSERGSTGKSVNLKFLLQDEFQKSGKPSIWLQNNNILIGKTKKEFSQDMLKDFVVKEQMHNGHDHLFWLKVKGEGDEEKADSKILYVNDKEEKVFVKLISLIQAEYMKGARLPYKHLVYEEFNVGSEKVPDLVEKFDSLLHSLEDLVAYSNTQQDLRIWFIGNNKSLNNPLIYRLGISRLDHELTEVYDDNNNKLMLVIAPQILDQQMKIIEESNKHNFIFQLSKQLGTADHSYFNKSLFDEVNNIAIYSLKELEIKLTIYHKKNYVNIYRVKSTGRYHCIEVNKNQALKKMYAFSKKDVKEKVELNNQLKKTLAKYISADKITFDNVVSRELIISALRT